MARIEDLGESLLSQQSANRDKAEKRRRKDERIQKTLGVLVAGQGIVNSALKRRSQEIKDAGTISKQRTKIQAQNFNKLTPIFQEIQSYGVDGYDQFEADFDKDPSKFNKLKLHLKPVTGSYIDSIVGKSDNPAIRAATFNQLENEAVKNAVKGALPQIEQFNRGISALADDIGVDKNSMFDHFTGLSPNDLDAYKAQKTTDRLKSYGTSIFGGGAWRGLGNALTFGLIKEGKGQDNPFKKIEEDWSPLNADIKKVFANYNVNKIISDTVRDNIATMKDYTASYEANADLKTRMLTVFDKTNERINRDAGFFKNLFQPDSSTDRYSKFKEHRIDNVIDDINSKTVIKSQILQTAGAISDRMLDPNETEFRNTFINLYAKEFNLEEGSAPYNNFVSALSTVEARDELVMDFVFSQVITDKFEGNIVDDAFDQVTFLDPFVYDFSKIDMLIKPSFKTTRNENGGMSFEPTSVYTGGSNADKIQAYNAYVKGILTNSIRSKLNPNELQVVAKKFIEDVPYPGEGSGMNVISRILDGLTVDTVNVRTLKTL